MKGKISVVILAALLGGSFTTARAENASTSYALTVSTGGYGSSSGHGVKLGYDVVGSGMSDSFGVEGVYMIKGTDRGDDHLFRIDVIAPVTPRGHLVPFLALGPGWISGNDVSSFALSLAFGGGVKYLVSDHLALRGDLRDMLVYGQKPSANGIEYTVGLSWIFGKKEWPIEDLEQEKAAGKGALPAGSPSAVTDGNRAGDAAPKPARETVKTDVKPAAETVKKGVEAAAAETVKMEPAASGPEAGEKEKQASPDETAKEVRAATAALSVASPRKGEHPEAVSASPGQQPSSEKVTTAACAGREAPALTQPVPDAAGVRALAVVKGRSSSSELQPAPKESLPAACGELTAELPRDRSLQEMTVGFALNRSDISRKYLGPLGKIADYLKQNRDAKAAISGHTDSSGPLRHNLELSRRRAESVKRYLVKQGIAPSRLITKGYGPCLPVAGNRTPATRKHNRRATAVVTFITHN